MSLVSVIIPALNEASTIAEVVEVARRCSFIHEAIVVSDGSTDRTAQVAREAGATVYELASHAGKGQAILHGVSRAHGDILLFLDADLLGLTVIHLERLLMPVLSGEMTMCVGRRDRGAYINAISDRLLLLSGERAIKRSVFEQIDKRFLVGYGLEIAMNVFCRSHMLAYKSVMLPGLTIRHKYEKVSFGRAVFQYLAMSFQVGVALARVQFARLRRKF